MSGTSGRRTLRPSVLSFRHPKITAHAESKGRPFPSKFEKLAQFPVSLLAHVKFQQFPVVSLCQALFEGNAAEICAGADVQEFGPASSLTHSLPSQTPSLSSGSPLIWSPQKQGATVSPKKARQVRTGQKTAKEAALSAGEERRDRSPSPPPPSQHSEEDRPLIQDDVAPMAEESDDERGGKEEIGESREEKKEIGAPECAWWAKYGDRPKAKPCYGEVSTLGHHYHGELNLCERHVCSAREQGCRLIARPAGYKCSACSRTADGKEKIKEYDRGRHEEKLV